VVFFALEPEATQFYSILTQNNLDQNSQYATNVKLLLALLEHTIWLLLSPEA